MTTALTLSRREPISETLIVSPPAQIEADEIVARASGSKLDGFQLVIDGQEVQLGDNLSRLVAHVIEGAANRGSMTIRTMPPEVSTTVAAHELGISRPTLMKMIRAGEIPSHPVGSHTRLKFEDVLDAAARLNAQKDEAFLRLLHVSETLGER
ncbi:excisionase family DNA-binding protein [Galbitalea soli]|uniref:Excisionase family DNA-binding protein n=1 Tax=Galbitalea soli TaxID=1268042 RepID=A0A7C9TPY6_9MICO|nr:excisionase family DNA-binding protein [Galbitalea soli]NEM91056.1 excisionase family DNA-binding protein [Galbitalea soli]NYJ29744.1 excisionase family DNA binding protein [Galbitalea soli]